VSYGSPDRVDSPPSKAVLVDLAGPRARVRTADLGRTNVLGEMLWLAPGRVVFAPTRGDADRIRVYDAGLEVVARGGRLSAADVVLRRGRLVALAAPLLFEADPPASPLAELAVLPSPVVHVLASLG
jgi:hypothetical protein